MPRLLISSQFCAGSAFGRIAPGDSGRPALLRLFYPTENLSKNLSLIFRSFNAGPQYTIIGVVAGSFRFGDGYYTYIAHQDILSWLQEFVNMKDLEILETTTKGSALSPSSTIIYSTSRRTTVISNLRLTAPLGDSMEEGKDIYFICDCDCKLKEGDAVMWYHDNVEVKEDPRFGIIMREQAIVLEKLRPNQGGTYRCELHSEQGIIRSNEITLIILSRLIYMYVDISTITLHLF